MTCTAFRGATAALLAAVAALPTGRVILPGLDRTVDAADWAAIEADPVHPQHGMALLLRRFGLAPAEVAEWPDAGFRTPPPSRRRLIAEALRPAATLGDQAHALEHRQVLGNRGAGDWEMVGDVAGRQLLAPDETQNLTSSGLDECFQTRLHSPLCYCKVT